MQGGRRIDHGRGRRRPRQTRVHGVDFFSGVSGRGVCAALGVRSDAPFQPGQSDPDPLRPGVVRCSRAHVVSASTFLPRSDIGELSRRVRLANADRRSLRVVGAGTWLATGAPIDAAEDIGGASNDAIIEYVPGDLTITVGAGMSLGAITEATAAHDQWLTLDPFGSVTGTIGATVSTASAGPLAPGFGAPRALGPGIEAGSGTGDVNRARGGLRSKVAACD